MKQAIKKIWKFLESPDAPYVQQGIFMIETLAQKDPTIWEQFAKGCFVDERGQICTPKKFRVHEDFRQIGRAHV